MGVLERGLADQDYIELTCLTKNDCVTQQKIVNNLSDSVDISFWILWLQEQPNYCNMYIESSLEMMYSEHLK